MPRRRKAPTRIMINATTRLANCKSIDPTLKLADDLDNNVFETALNTSQTHLDTYNGFPASADAELNKFYQSEDVLKDIHERMLDGVGVKYGKDSDEYEMAGGVRKSERKKPTKKDKPGEE